MKNLIIAIILSSISTMTNLYGQDCDQADFKDRFSGAQYHSISISPDGTIDTWGNMHNANDVIAEDLSDVIAVSAGNKQTITLHSDRTIKVHGYYYGWVECCSYVDDMSSYNIPGEDNGTEGLSNVMSIAAGDEHNLALLLDGTVVAWGRNDPSNNHYNGQTDVPLDLIDVIAIDAGYRFSIALKSDGTVVGWGNSEHNAENIPTGLSDVVAISSAQYENLALHSDGTITQWGHPREMDIPSEIQGNAVAIAAGHRFGLALKSDGTVSAWGINDQGQIDIPEGLTDVIAIDAGHYHSMALKSDGTIVSWGNTADVPDGLLVDIDCSVSGCTDDFALNFNPDANVNNGTCEYDPLSTLTDIDGNVYEVIQIGEQYWLSENLRVTHYNNGDEISYITNNADWGSYDEGQFGAYDNDDSYVDTYGYLYNWAVVDDDRGVCPEGYDVASNVDINLLKSHTGTNAGGVALGGKLKESGHEHWTYHSDAVSEAATNEYEFTALPNGARAPNGNFSQIGEYSHLWSATPENQTGNRAWKFAASYNNSTFSGNYDYDKRTGYAVRCISNPSILGCTNPDACNYNVDATDDDASCLENDCAGECGGDVTIDYCGICDGENVQTECYDIEECVNTFQVIGYNPWGDDWNDGSNCVNGLGFYVFDWEGGCVPDYYVASNSGYVSYMDPSWTDGFWWWGFEPSTSESFIFYFADGTSVEVNDVMNECEIEPTFCGDGDCNGDETFESCYDDCYYYEDCIDFTCDGEDWHDPDGELWDCDLYVSSGYCGEEWIVNYPWCGMTADQACCGCMDIQSSADDDRDSTTTSRTKFGGYVHPFAPSDTRNGCPGEGPDVGCDGVCFSDLTVDACGECEGTEENTDSCDNDVCESGYFWAYEDEACEQCSELNNPCDDCICDDFGLETEQACLAACVGGSDDPPECILDCPDVDILIAFFEMGEGELSSDDICTIFASWGGIECLDDCMDDNGDAVNDSTNEIMDIIGLCTECLAEDGNCEGLFEDDDPESDCSCSGCEADFCFGDEYCGSSNPNFGVDGDGEIYCDWLDEWPMCWDPSCEQADECDGEYDDCGVCDGPAIAGSGDINADGDLNINDIVMMVSIIVGNFNFSDHDFSNNDEPIDGCVLSLGDINNDGALDIFDVITVVNIILYGDDLAKFAEQKINAPSSVEIIKGNGVLSYQTDKNGLIGFEFILSHGDDFSITLNEGSFLSDYNTSGNETKVVMVMETGSELFTTVGDYDIEELLVGVVTGELLNVNIVDTPTEFALSQAYPNPFNPIISFNLSIVTEGYASVNVYNLMGQVVGNIHNGNLAASTHSFVWDARELSSGMYILQAQSEGKIQSQKIMLLK